MLTALVIAVVALYALLAVALFSALALSGRLSEQERIHRARRNAQQDAAETAHPDLAYRPCRYYAWPSDYEHATQHLPQNDYSGWGVTFTDPPLIWVVAPAPTLDALEEALDLRRVPAPTTEDAHW